MGWFKRLCMFLFGLCGLAALVVLSLTWVGPWTHQMRSLLEQQWFFYTLEALVVISAIGLFAMVCVALFAPRNPKETVVAEVEGGKITVTRHAIVSQVRHVIEGNGTCKATSIRVKMRKRGHIRVSARVKPVLPIDVISYGTELYQALGAGLAEVCGESVDSIDVVFLEPQRMEAAEDSETDGQDIQVRPQANQTQETQASSARGKDQVISVRPEVLEHTAAAEDVEPEPEFGTESEERPLAFEDEELADTAQLVLDEAAGEEGAHEAYEGVGVEDTPADDGWEA